MIITKETDYALRILRVLLEDVYKRQQLNQAGSKNLLKKSETLKEKLYHMWVYLVKIAATMAFCRCV